MAFSIVVTRISVLVLVLILLCGHITPSTSENANLYRLKKLRNSFIEQVDEQVASNEELLESQYLTTVKDLVDRISQTIREAVEEITALQRNFVGMAPQCEASVTPRAMFTTADAALNACVSRAEENGASISEYVISEIERFQTKTTDFSLWFNEAFLSDWENDIFSSNHYHDVYDELEAKVLLWDNVER